MPQTHCHREVKFPVQSVIVQWGCEEGQFLLVAHVASKNWDRVWLKTWGQPSKGIHGTVSYVIGCRSSEDDQDLASHGRLFAIGLQERHNSTFRHRSLSETRSAYQRIQACGLNRWGTKVPTRKDMP